MMVIAMHCWVKNTSNINNDVTGLKNCRVAGPFESGVSVSWQQLEQSTCKYFITVEFSIMSSNHFPVIHLFFGAHWQRIALGKGKQSTRREWQEYTTNEHRLFIHYENMNQVPIAISAGEMFQCSLHRSELLMLAHDRTMYAGEWLDSRRNLLFRCEFFGRSDWLC